MTTSPRTTVPPSTRPEVRPLRLVLATERRPGSPDGAWWPRSRSLAVEGADLVDHFPPGDRVARLLFSRPDWDDALVEGRGRRRILTARGPVKVGSFPRDDTHLVVLTVGGGRRLSVVVVPSDTSPAEAEQAMDAVRAVRA